MPTFRGFILQPTYRVESGDPVVHLFGRLEDGRSFLVRDRRLVPRFYVEKADAARARELGARTQASTDQVTLLGRPVVRVEVREPADTPPLRDRLEKAGIRTYEADVRFAMRHLIDRGIRGSLEIHGEGCETPGLGLVFEDPEILPGDWTPRLSVLSLDIETDPAARRLLAIGLHGCGASEVLLLTPPGRRLPGRSAPLPDREGPAGGPLAPACASWTPTCSPAGTWSTSTSPCSTGSPAGTACPSSWGGGRGRSVSAPRAVRGGRARPPSPAASSSTGSSSCAAPSSGWRTTASTRWPARSWARARPSPGAAAPRRSCVSSRRTGSASSSTTAPTRASPSRCSSGSASSSSPSSAAASPACPSIASPPRSPPSTSSTSPSSDGDGSWPRASARRPRSWSRRAADTSSSPSPASTRTSSCWTSRACTRASSAPSRSTP